MLIDTKSNSSIPYTHSSIINQQLNILIENPPQHPLKCILVGGSTICPSIIKALQKKLPLYRSYGCTETASAVTLGKLTPSDL